MSPMVKLLNEMRGHCSVAIYVGETSLLKLADFLRGYEYALYKTGVEHDQFLADFRDWIQHRFVSTKHGWEQLIVMNSANDGDAIAHFWRLLDEFLALYPQYAGKAATVPITASPVRGTESIDSVGKPA